MKMISSLREGLQGIFQEEEEDNHQGGAKHNTHIFTYVLVLYL